MIDEEIKILLTMISMFLSGAAIGISTCTFITIMARRKDK